MNKWPADRPVRLRARVTLSHVALQAELLVHEIHAANRNTVAPPLTQEDIDTLHRMVADCLLFLRTEG